MYYSPVRRSSAGSKLPLLPLDLHVLSLPPAFNLSHDQTLQFKSYKNPKILYSCSRQNSISTSHCPDISYPKYLGQRPHELLGQLFKERSGLARSRWRILHRITALSTVYFGSDSKPENCQLIQTVAFQFLTRLSGVSLERDAHSTGPCACVNELNQLFLLYLGLHLRHCSNRMQDDHFSYRNHADWPEERRDFRNKANTGPDNA